MKTTAKLLFAIALISSSGCLGLLEDVEDDVSTLAEQARLDAEKAARKAACDAIPDGAPLPAECGGGEGVIKQEVQTRAVVLTASDSAGSLSTVDLDSLAVRDDPVPALAVSSDAVASYQLGHVIVLNRDLNNVTILDPSDDFSIRGQYATRPNPQAFAAAGTDKAYITSYEENIIDIVSPFTGEVLGEIDVSEYADNDSTAEVAGAVVVEERLFVAVQRLDRSAFYAPTDVSYLLVIDMATDAVSEVITLQNTNPVDLRYDAGRKKLLVAEVSAFGDTEGGIEIIDPFTLASEGNLITEEQVKADLSTYAVDSTGNILFIGSDELWNTTINRWDAVDAYAEIVTSSVGWKFFCGAANDRGEFWVCDRSDGAPGVRIFSFAEGAELTNVPIQTALSPMNGIVFVP